MSVTPWERRTIADASRGVESSRTSGADRWSLFETDDNFVCFAQTMDSDSPVCSVVRRMGRSDRELVEEFLDGTTGSVWRAAERAMQEGGRFDGIASELATESDDPGLFTDDEDVVV